jgi:GDP-4-dehydro-6-deoxy-D-mannose reductase
MLAEWTVQLLRGGDQPVDVASLDVTTDVLDVRDGVRALRLLAQRGAGGETYNLGSGVSRTTGDVFRLLRKHFDEAREVRQLRPGRRYDPIADVAKLRAAVGWSPQIPLEQTVADVVSDWRRRLSG